MHSPAIKQVLNIFKQLRDIDSSVSDQGEKITEIMRKICLLTDAESVFCYSVADDNYLELLADFGEDIPVLKKPRIRFGEGLIGEIAAKRRLINVENFNFGSKIALPGENNPEKSFAGLPIWQWNRVIGVLAIVKSSPIGNEIDILQNIAMFLAEILTSPQMGQYRQDLRKSRGIGSKERLRGISLNKGYGLGSAVIHRRLQSVTNIFAEDKQKEKQLLAISHRQMVEDLDNQLNETRLGLGEHTEILSAYKMFAKDKGWYAKIVDNIEAGLSAPAAVERTFEDMWNRLSASSDIYLKERLHDLRDISDRLLSYLSGQGDKKTPDIKGDIILVAQSMGPAELMDYEYERIRGIILEEGTPTMHVAIVAKALNIPVLAKIKGVFNEIQAGQTIAIDGNDGFVYVNPSPHRIKEFALKIAESKEERQRLAALREKPCVTKDGIKIGMYLNIGLPLDFDYIKETNCDGVGLYRTEIPFMSSESMPDAAKQFSYYDDLLSRCGDKKVIFRSLDVGSDKLLPYWAYGGEDNPAIGWRSIRITLDRRAILRTQIKAFLQAAAGKDLYVMFPMIADYKEFEEARETLFLEAQRQQKRGCAMPKNIKVGLMIEVPSVIFQLDNILPIADFISVGTNDLAQFMFACDRGNPRLLNRYGVLSAPFLAVLKKIVDKAKFYNVECSVCGEMASNPAEALALLGLGYRNLSCSGAMYGKIKNMILSIDCASLEDYIMSLSGSSRESLRSQIISYAYDHDIEIY